MNLCRSKKPQMTVALPSRAASKAVDTTHCAGAGQ